MSHAQTIIAATTAAVATTVPLPTDSINYGEIYLSADNLAGAEEVDIQVLAGSAWKTVTDLTGAAVKLTADISIVELAGGPTYGVLKDETAGACAVYMTPGTRRT